MLLRVKAPNVARRVTMPRKLANSASGSPCQPASVRTVDATPGTVAAPPHPMRWAYYVALAMLALLPARMDTPMMWTAGVIQAHAPAGAATPTSPPVADLGPTQPIAGWIVDGAGLPIAGVRVSLRGANATATSEADGAFRIAAPAGKRTLLLDAPHVFPAELAWRDGEPAPRIMLARRARLEARVVIDGKPIAGAEVQITD